MIPNCKNNSLEEKYNKLIDDLYYKPNDYLISDSYFVSGYVTSLRKSIHIFIVVDKSMYNINNIIIEKFGGSIRHSLGGYIFETAYGGANHSILKESTFSDYTAHKMNNYTILAKFNFTSEIPVYYANGSQVTNSAITNNYLIGTVIEDLKIRFE